MEAAQVLWDLQELDLRIAKDGAQLEAERARMQEPASIRQARAAIAAAEAQLTALQREIRSAEQEAQSVAAKKAEVHAKLYGGRVSVPRELTALESEENALAATFSQLEDRQLDLMAGAEAAEASLASALTALEDAQTRWRDEGREAHAQIDRLEAEVDQLRRDRAEVAGQVSPSNLALYDRFSRSKAGRAVAEVRDNMCQACRTTLPLRDVQRARGADPPHQCENCARLLLVR
jgi:predicted  nucleic acid-binding Zn-ribbon protein